MNGKFFVYIFIKIFCFHWEVIKTSLVRHCDLFTFQNLRKISIYLTFNEKNGEIIKLIQHERQGLAYSSAEGANCALSDSIKR